MSTPCFRMRRREHCLQPALEPGLLGLGLLTEGAEGMLLCAADGREDKEGKQGKTRWIHDRAIDGSVRTADNCSVSLFAERKSQLSIDNRQ